ncbi:MAG: 2-C-methyl-D-erythritol 4-phosphate cytidylyltransferase [Puniceicoccales bacterium]|jgi:2-C-methyl-D-erythritol 4-phosphate cytidylyltransferase|nr:2-C-methyl-D-erythritol 4-phosphate cytidylyltransferase [Puniceicoccales bacterium]
MNIAIVVAAGRGRRFGENNKILAPLGNKPILFWSLETLAQHRLVDRLVGVVSEECRPTMESFSSPKLAGVVAGGLERFHSVYNGLEFGQHHFGKGHTVLVHDGARPLVDSFTIDRLLQAPHSAAIPVWPTQETIVQSAESSTPIFPDRLHLYTVQTPQVFPLDKLLEAHRKYRNTALPPAVYDDGGLFHWAFPQETIALVEGNQRNLKITTPIDLTLAELLLRPPIFP